MKTSAPPVYRRILVATDGSPLSRKALSAAARLAAAHHARLSAIHVIAPWVPVAVADGFAFVEVYDERAYMEAMRKASQRTLAAAAKVAAKHGVRCESVSVVAAAPWDAILRAARSRKCDLVVMASHGRGGLKAVVLGSETHKVLTHSKLPVLVVR